MTLRNAFENLATEPKQDGIISYLRALIRSTTYARTASDQMRVVMDSGSTTVVTGTTVTATSIYWANAGNATGWYGTGGPNSIDAREQQMMASNTQIALAMQRWTVG